MEIKHEHVLSGQGRLGVALKSWRRAAAPAADRDVD